MIRIRVSIGADSALDIRWCSRNFTLHEYRFFIANGDLIHVFKEEEAVNFFLLSRKVDVISITKTVDDNSDNRDSDNFYKYERLW